jgi:uncharacterized damage-inducible protein DinB
VYFDETVKSLNSIVERLGRSQRGFLLAADAVPAEQWKTNPGEDRWSASEVAGHLIVVECRILGGTDRLLQKPPNPRPFLKRFHIPMVVVEARLFRRKSPIPLDCQTIHEKEEMLAELRRVRERTLAFIEEIRGRDLCQYCMPHPFIGTLTVDEWFEFIASHEIRHTKQMAEIIASLPKNITKLQK